MTALGGGDRYCSNNNSIIERPNEGSSSNNNERSFANILNKQKSMDSTYHGGSGFYKASENNWHSSQNVAAKHGGCEASPGGMGGGLSQRNLNNPLGAGGVLGGGQQRSVLNLSMVASNNSGTGSIKSHKWKKNFTIQVLGGISEQNSMIVEKFESKSGLWNVMETRAAGRNKFGCVLTPSKRILVFGGKTNTHNKIKNSEEFDPKTSTWRPGKIELFEAKSGFGYTLYNKKIYLAGGNNGTTALDNFEEYDVFTGERHRLPAMLAAREEFSLVYTNKTIYAIGGGSINGAVLKSVEKYNLDAKVWEKCPDMIFPRRVHGVTC